MVPLIELRGAVIYSQYLEMPVLQSYLVCALGNILPMPFVYLFAHKILVWGADKKYIGKIFTFLLEKGHESPAEVTQDLSGPDRPVSARGEGGMVGSRTGNYEYVIQGDAGEYYRGQDDGKAPGRRDVPCRFLQGSGYPHQGPLPEYR